MKKLDLGQTITILANAGVIAGIIFLGVELQQNNELMRAEARDAQNVRLHEFVQQVYTVPELAEILFKVRKGEPLTEVEKIRLRGRQGRQLSGVAAQWREYREGAAESPDPSLVRRYFYEGGYYSPPLHDAWEEVKTSLSPDFVQWMEENVVNER